MELYHSSPKAFEKFSVTEIGKSTEINKYGYGFYFSESEEDVIEHAQRSFIKGRPFYVYTVKIIGFDYVVDCNDEVNSRLFSKIIDAANLDRFDSFQIRSEYKEFGFIYQQLYDHIALSIGAKKTSDIFDAVGITGFKIIDSGWYNSPIYCIFSPSNIKIISDEEYT